MLRDTPKKRLRKEVSYIKVNGLSITELQLFSGLLPPLNKNDWILYFNLYKEIPEFKLQNFNMTLQEFKVIFWWEWAHRFLGRVIGLFFLIPLRLCNESMIAL